MSNFIILSTISKHGGWGPVIHMTELLAEYLAAPIVNLELSPSIYQKGKYYLRRRPRNPEKPNAILVVQTAAHVRHLCAIPSLSQKFNQIVVWVFDSFFTEFIPKTPMSNLVDHIFITSISDLEEYQAKVNVGVSVIKRGVDAMTIKPSNVERDIDVLRIGRQPLDWDDDNRNAELCDSLNLRYESRPPDTLFEGSQQLGLMENFLKRAKVVIAHSNRFDSSDHTHPKKEYFTERWFDALACGCIVAGVAPKKDKVYDDLWEGALLELDNTNLEMGLSKITERLRDWSESDAHLNHELSLARLDWRHRFKEITCFFDIEIPALESDLSQIIGRHTNG